MLLLWGEDSRYWAVGLGYSFAQFISGVDGAEAVKAYRARFRPSAAFSEPRANLGIGVLCADTCLDQLASVRDQVPDLAWVLAIETDEEVIAAIWEKNPLLRQYLGTPENPQFVLYRIDPERVRFMREWALEYFEVVGREQ